MSKDLFMMLREQEISEAYPTKKSLISEGKNFAKKIIDSGESEITEIYAQAIRLKEVINSIESELKKELPEKFESYGLKGAYRSGGSVLNYSEDDIIKNLEDKIKQRKELLKTAYNSDETIYDSDGVEVPKVSVTERKGSITITF